MYRRIITRARTSCLVTSSRNGAIEYEKDPAFIDYCLLLIAGVLLPFAPKRFGERRQVRLHQQVGRRHERRDDHDVARDVHRVGYQLAQRRDDAVGADEHEGRRKAHAERVLERRRHRERRTQSQHEPERRIVLEDSRPEGEPSFHGRNYSISRRSPQSPLRG